MTAPQPRKGPGFKLLVSTSDFGWAVNTMTRMVDYPPGGELQMTGEWAPLNALIALGRTDRVAFENLLADAEKARAQRPTTRRVDSVRNNMRLGRVRMRKVVEIAALRLGRRLTLEEVTNLTRATRARWAETRAKVFKDTEGLLWDARLEAQRKAWQDYDDQLNRDLADLRKQAGRTRAHTRVALSAKTTSQVNS